MEQPVIAARRRRKTLAVARRPAGISSRRIAGVYPYHLVGAAGYRDIDGAFRRQIDEIAPPGPGKAETGIDKVLSRSQLMEGQRPEEIPD